MLDINTLKRSKNSGKHRTSILPLDVQDLVYEDRGKRIIHSINLHIEPTGCTAIMGYNGAGKSVLVRLLHGLLPPSSGIFKWSGDFTKDEISRRQSMVFQTPVLLRRSVEANIEYALRKRGLNREECSLRLEEILREGNLIKLRKRLVLIRLQLWRLKRSSSVLCMLGEN